MATLQVLRTSIVVVGDVFTPPLLTPDLFRQFFRDERPRGVATTMISVLEYPLSGYGLSLEEKKFQVAKQEPDPASLEELTKIASKFLKSNQLVKVTAVGLNIEGFVSYAGHAGAQEQNGEARFLSTFVVVDALKEFVDSDIRSGTLQVVYEAKGNRCGLTLQSDAVVKDNKGVALGLNVHKDVSRRKEVYSHIARLQDWSSYFVGLGERLSRHFER
jgi:hypothetical protein